MNDVFKAIRERRSVRFFKPDSIAHTDLKAIVEAGNCAPSGAGTRMWRFVVVENEEFRRKLADLALPRYRNWIEKAPDFLKMMRAEIDSVVTDPVYYSASAIVFVIGKGMTADYDCSMVCQNMMLAAKSLGIGSCWVYFGQLVLDDPGIGNDLRLAEDEKVYGPIVFGYPQDNLPESTPRNAPEIHWID